MHRIYEAKLNNLPEVIVWGDGSPKREFMFSEDLAKNLVKCMMLNKKTFYQNIEENYPKFFLCGLICIITETLLWDANDSIFFWVLTMYALNAQNENVTLNDKYKFVD